MEFLLSAESFSQTFFFTGLLIVCNINMAFIANHLAAYDKL